MGFLGWLTRMTTTTELGHHLRELKYIPYGN